MSDTSTITFDQILTSMTDYSILEFAAFKSDYPVLNLPGSGQKHKIKVVYPLAGYVYLEDIDLSNNVIYINRHDGNNYSGWMRLQSAVLDMQNAWVTGFRVPGWGLIVQLPYFDNIQITIAEVFNDLSQWETITLSNIQSCGNIKSLVFNFSETNIKETRPYLIRLSGTIQ